MNYQNKKQRTFRNVMISSALAISIASGIFFIAKGIEEYGSSIGFTKAFDNAYASNTACMTTSEALLKSNMRIAIPEALGKRSFQCIIGQNGELTATYSDMPIPRDAFGSLKSHNSVLVTIQNMTLLGKNPLDVEKELGKTYDIVKERRPDLKPNTFLINGHYAWGEEGGPNASLVTIENANGTIVYRYTESAPSRLYVANNGVQYLIQANMPLDEIIPLAKGFG